MPTIPTNPVVQQQRVQTIAQMLLEGKPRSEIDKFCSINYNMNKGTDWKLIKAAYKWISENHKVDKSDIIELHINYYYKIFTDSYKKKPLVAMKALERIEKLLGLYLPDITNVQNNSLNISLKDLGVDDLKNLLE